MSTSDFVGISTLITATSAAIVSIIVALRQTSVRAEVSAVANQVATRNGKTMGEIIDGYEDRRVEDGGR